MNPKNILATAVLSLLYFPSAAATLIPRESAYVIPTTQQGLPNPIIRLDGQWDFRYSAASPWTSIQVPGEAAMQGYAIRHDQPFYYRKHVNIPAAFKGRRIILRFDGVYSHAKLHVNGHFVKEHHGGFTRWEADITPYVKPGKTTELTLEVTDRLDDVSYASGYAHHPVGGILRSVTLFARPKAFINNFYAETDLDSIYRNATLRIAFEADADMTVHYTLTPPQGGHPVSLTDATYDVRQGGNVHAITITNPQKWDAEHPHLYTLIASFTRNGRSVGSFSRRIGFREVEIRGDRMFVNGRQVKLRGACRHDIHPTLGRMTTPELDSLDALRFKQSNMNFVRTSHYPPSEQFLNYCDQFGIYVECETAACFVDTYRQKNYAPGRSQDSAAFTPRYLGQLQEMVNQHRSHPSVLFWSIGNESVYGRNFQASWDWLKAADKTRPVIFSYPGTAPAGKPIYDILSMHYPGWDGNLDQWNHSVRGFQGEGIPALFDEWAHPACYTYETLQNDPGIREFWGLSIEKMWSRLYEAPGGLGGAIWGYIDETFALPQPKVGDAFWEEFAHTAKPDGYRGRCVGYGEWGIVDVWRRPKPEFWATKKAYSPIRLLQTQVDDPIPGQPIVLPVYNRFDHTNLNEITVRYTYQNHDYTARISPAAPHTRGQLTLPGAPWQSGTQTDIRFYDVTGMLIDHERLTLGTMPHSMPESTAHGSLKLAETDTHYIIQGKGFNIPVNKESGLIEHATVAEQEIISRGPLLNLFINLNHLSGAEVRKMASRIITQPADWHKDSLSVNLSNDGQAHISLSGTYAHGIQAHIYIAITSEGRMGITYHTEGEPNGYLREEGLAFELPAGLSHLTWERQGQWTYYPADAMAGNAGSTPLFGNNPAAPYGTRPAGNWADDTHNYYYWADAGANCSRPLSQRAKSMKENIYHYTLSTNPSRGSALSVCSPTATLACRLNTAPESGQLTLYVNNRWDYPEIAWGNYCHTLQASPCSGSIQLLLHEMK